MARILNIRTEQNKKEIKELLEQVDASTWQEPDDSPLALHIKKAESYRKAFVKKHHIKDDDETVLYEMCKVLKKKKLKIDEDTCWLASNACDIIICLTVGGKCVKNDFYLKVDEVWNKSDEVKYKFLAKNAKYWMNEIQTALKNKDFDLLTNSEALMMFFSGYAMGVYYDDK